MLSSQALKASEKYYRRRATLGLNVSLAPILNEGDIDTRFNRHLAHLKHPPFALVSSVYDCVAPTQPVLQYRRSLWVCSLSGHPVHRPSPIRHPRCESRYRDTTRVQFRLWVGYRSPARQCENHSRLKAFVGITIHVRANIMNVQTDPMAGVVHIKSTIRLIS